MKTEKKILIVEDDLILLDNLHDLFRGGGFEVLLAKNGKEGLIIASKNHPDVILLDLLMPQINGITMMKNVRLNSWGKKIPIIILTNLNPDDLILKQIIQYKPSYYLIKSNLKINEVYDKVKEVLNNNN